MTDASIQAELQSCREALIAIEARWASVAAEQEATLDRYRQQVDAERQAEREADRERFEAEWQAKLDAERQPIEPEHEAEMETYRQQIEVKYNAEFSAYRKRAERDIERARQQERETVLREWLDVIDNLERALIHRDRAALAKLWEGLVAVYRLAQNLLKRYEISRIPTRDVQFDPTVHEAVGRARGAPDGAIVEEVKAGYHIGETVLRPAQVIVAVPDTPRRPPNGV